MYPITLVSKVVITYPYVGEVGSVSSTGTVIKLVEIYVGGSILVELAV